MKLDLRLGLVSVASMSATLVFAQLNVAAAANGGTASQISTYPGGDASKAIDGDRNGEWGHGSVSHTNYHLNADWVGTFAADSMIDTVRIFNRLDGYGYRLNPFSVYLLDSSDSVVWSSLGNTFTADITASSIEGMSFNTGGVSARKVRVMLDGSNYLQLAEVEAITAVPEPATMLVLGLGGLLAAKRRRTA